MFVRGFAICWIGLALLAAGQAPPKAQKVEAPKDEAPDAYTVTETNSIFGQPQVVKTYRMGSKVLVDQIAAVQAADPTAPHTLTYHDLQAHKSFTWSVAGGTSSGCSKAAFTGDWTDPFAALDELAGPNTKQLGTETIFGLQANILEASTPVAAFKGWVDSKSGLVLKVQASQADRPLTTVVEVTAFSFDPPPDSVFVIPADCATATAAAPENEKLAAVTGGSSQSFEEADEGPASKNSCTMLFRVVRAGTLAPITDGYQAAIDLDVVTEPTPSYVIGLSMSGHVTFSGGGLHEVTAQIRDGVLRIDEIPERFELELAFGGAGSSSTQIYRKCFAPQTALLFAVKNPAALSEGGEWMWVKSGKYAAIPK